MTLVHSPTTTSDLSANVVKILNERYLRRDSDGKIIETPDDMFRRVAQAVAKAEAKEDQEVWESKFYDLLSSRRFLPNSPTLMNAGTGAGTLSACFVIGVSDSMTSILAAAQTAGMVLKYGGGVGYYLGDIRAKGLPIKTTHGKACGPVRVLKHYDSLSKLITQGGKRNGANMAVLPIDHPDIKEFIHAKDANYGAKEGRETIADFNISVLVTNEWIDKVNSGDKEANALFNEIIESAWKTGDPGMLFFDAMNADNPTIKNLGVLKSTNPCVTKDTWVITPNGEKQVKDLLAIGEALEFRGKFYKASNFFKTGIKPVFLVQTQLGLSIKTTEDHKLLLANNTWKEVKDLVIDVDILAVNSYLKHGATETKVISITEFPPEDVYDVSVDTVHAFSANGLVAHNCGEVPLYANEACNLGSINLSRYYQVATNDIDIPRLLQDVHIAVHFLDNVVSVNDFPLQEIKEAVDRTRKIGLGVMGWADLLILMGIPYESEKAVALADSLMCAIQLAADNESETLGKAHGTYPKWLGSTHAEQELKYRNATRTCIAPTGTISRIAEASSGIEPLFALAFESKVLNGAVLQDVNETFIHVAKREGFYSEELIAYALKNGNVTDRADVPAKWHGVLKTANEIAVEWHIKHQSAFQKYINLAVSKTINLPNSATVEDIRKAYLLAAQNGCKGVTVYRDGCREFQVLNTGIGKKEPESVPDVSPATMHRIPTPLGKNAHITITLNSKRVPIEAFLVLGKPGTDIAADTEAIGRLTSLALRSGVPVKEIWKQLVGISTDQVAYFGKRKILSVPDALAAALEYHLDAPVSQIISSNGHNGNNGYHEICPDCGSRLIHEEKCLKCVNTACGFSKC